MGPISEQEAAGYVEHLAACADRRLCSHYAHLWEMAEHVLTCDNRQCGEAHVWAETTEQGRVAVSTAMRGDRERAAS